MKTLRSGKCLAIAKGYRIYAEPYVLKYTGSNVLDPG